VENLDNEEEKWVDVMEDGGFVIGVAADEGHVMVISSHDETGALMDRLLILDRFEQFPDRIVLVYGRDGIHDRNLATHGFLHRRWVDTVGYFVPPLFASDFNDTWLDEVARAVGRRQYVPEVYYEHLHPAVGKAPMDRTHQERLQRHVRENCDQIWRDTAGLRKLDADKLRAAIEEYAHVGS
jgi:hypothetical protein